MHVQQKRNVVHTLEQCRLNGSPPPAQEPLPPAPRVLDMMHDCSSGEAGDYDQEGNKHDALSLPFAGQSSVRRSHAEQDRSRFGSIELFGPLGKVEREAAPEP
jgi:hypothetical protein